MKTYFSAFGALARRASIPAAVVALILTFPALLASATLLNSGSGAASPRAAMMAGCSATLVDIATDATDPSNNGDTEPSIAVNPVNPMEIAVVAFSGGWSATTMAPVWKSSDGGGTWRRVPQLPQPVASSTAPGDQKVAYDSAGRLFVAELAFKSPSPRLFIFRQTNLLLPDAPLTPGTVFGSSNDDQPHLDVDKLSAGSCANMVYSPWLNFAVSNERSTVGNSNNSGATVTSVGAGDNSTFVNRTTRMALAPNGRAYIIYKTREGAVGTRFENAHFRVNRSDDCGANWNAIGGTAGVSVHGAATVVTWQTQVDTNCTAAGRVNGFGNSAKGLVARARSSDAWIAVDPSDGDVFAAYVSQDASTFGQIYVARSTDQGLNWTSTRVTDGTHHSAYPEIAVTSAGVVGVLYIDYDDSGANTIFRHRFAFSTNNGATWTDQILQSMNPGTLAGAGDCFLWGDYEDVTANGNTFYGVFTGQSIGRTTAQLDPIFFKVPIAPQIQTPASVAFADTCVGTTSSQTLHICNNGCATNLVISSITPSNSQFSVAAPAGGFPVTIAAGACFDFTVKFTPTSSGAESGSFSIASNDPATPASVPASGLARKLESITCPADKTVSAGSPGATSAVVTYPPPTVVDSFCATSVVCTPPSGASFPLGVTTVNCKATDAANNSVSCSFKVTVFDICLQDDKSGDILFINTFTGDYQFVRCGVGGFTMTGKGSITRVGCITRLEDDTRVMFAEIDRCPIAPHNTGTASIKRPNPGTTFTINDSNILNNGCACP
jgi:hypothetical protein